MPEYTSKLNLYKPNRVDSEITVDTSLSANFQKIDDGFDEVTQQLAQNTHVNIKQFAKGDGITDDTIAFKDAINYCISQNNRRLYVPQGVYMINPVPIQDTPNIVIPSNFEILMDNQAFVKAITNGSNNYKIFSIDGAENVVIRGGNLVGDLDSHTGTTGEMGHGIHIRSSSNVLIENLNISKTWGDGIVMGRLFTGASDNKNITIRNCIIDEASRNGISVVSGIDVTIDNCIFRNIKRTLPKAAVDIEHNYETYNEIVKNVIVSNCRAYNVDGNVFLNDNGENVIFSNNLVDNEGNTTSDGNAFRVANGDAKNTKIIGNTIIGGRFGVSCCGEDVIVSSNNFKGITGAFAEVATSGVRVVFANNQFNDCFGNLAIRNNIISDNPQITISNNVFNNCGNSATGTLIDILKSGVRVIGNKFINGRNTEISAKNISNVQILDNDVSNPIGTLEFSTILLENSSDIVVRGNVINNSRFVGIQVISCLNIQVHSNRILGSRARSISVSGTATSKSKNIFISGNELFNAMLGNYGSSKYAMSLYMMDYSVVTNNVIGKHTTTTYGVYINSTTDCVFANNFLKDSGVSGNLSEVNNTNLQLISQNYI